MLQSIGTEANRDNDLVNDCPSTAKETKQRKSCPNKKKDGKKKDKAIDKRSRRPDMKLYVPPKAKNSSVEDTESTSPEDQTIAQISSPQTNEVADSISQLHITESSSHTKDKTSQKCSKDCSQTSDKQMSASNDSNETKETKANDNADEGSWDSLFDDNGECVRPEFAQRVKDLIGSKSADIKLEKSGIDYYTVEYTDLEIDNSEFGHILEAYDFAAELKTQDIMTTISVFK